MNGARWLEWRCGGILCLFLLVACLAGCDRTGWSAFDKHDPTDSRAAIGRELRAMEADNEIQRCIRSGLIELCAKDDPQKASEYFREGLRLNPGSGHLHFFNGLSYHMMSRSGDVRPLELAESGYLTALRFDEANYMAAYLLGHLYFAQSRYEEAKDRFAYALIYAPHDPDVLHAAAVAAYYAKDLPLLEWAASQAYALEPQAPEHVRTLAFSKAAVGQVGEARRLALRYDQERSAGAAPAGPERIARSPFLASRMNDWGRFYLTAGIFDGDTTTEDILGGDDADTGATGGSVFDREATPGAGSPLQPAGAPAAGDGQAKEPDLPKMVLIDVVILRSEETLSQAKGVNLMSGLRTTLSGTLFGYHRGVDEVKTEVNNQTQEQITDARNAFITTNFNFLALEYNLNIFNEKGNRAEVLARPSLLATENETSKFFSGSELQVQLNSNFADGTVTDVPIGISLQVTPRFLGRDRVQVAVSASKSFLEPLSEQIGFTAFAQTTKTSVDATAVLQFGETLVLSGLSENETESTRDGVPLLQSVPGVQYLFSRSEQSEIKKSVLILLTPRKARYLEDDLALDHLDSRLLRAGPARETYTSELKRKERIPSNLDALFHRLARDSSYYRQFRKGDVELESWSSQKSVWGGVKRVLGFVYY